MTLTLEEVIKQSEDIADANERIADIYKNHDKDFEEERRSTTKYYRQLAEWLKELKAYKDKDMRLIYAYPLDEAIRCAMCTNPIKSDRGCDGGCKVDEQMYKNVIEAVNGLIVEVNADERV